jgi:hypothetical protein
MATRAGDVTDGSTATFYSDFSEGTSAQTNAKPPADLHKLSYDAVTHRIIDTTYVTSWNKATTPWTPVVPAVPTSTKVIATDVTDNGGAPIFSYFAYNSVTQAPIPSPIVPLGAGGAQLTLAQLKQVARIDITFRVKPTRSIGNNPVGTVALQDEVYVRAADPNDDAPTPTCA